MRVFRRKNGIYYFEIARGKALSLRTSDEGEALAIVDRMMEGLPKPVCRMCSKEMEFRKQRYCSVACYHKAQNEIRRFGVLRSQVLAAFDNQCAVCGRDDSLHVHHIDGFGSTVPYAKRNNKLTNLIVLCPECHFKIHGSKDLAPPTGFWIGTNNKAVGDMIRSQMETINKLRAEIIRDKAISDKIVSKVSAT